MTDKDFVNQNDPTLELRSMLDGHIGIYRAGNFLSMLLWEDEEAFWRNMRNFLHRQMIRKLEL